LLGELCLPYVQMYHPPSPDPAGLASGRLMEQWVTADLLESLRQIGVMPSPTPARSPYHACRAVKASSDLIGRSTAWFLSICVTAWLGL